MKTIPCLEAFLSSNVGKIRNLNEDYLGFFPLSNPMGQRKYLAIISDGMGGHPSGEMASKFCVEKIYQYVMQSRETEPRSTLENALLRVHYELRSLHKELPSNRMPGCTCTAVYICGQGVFLAHIGDSRCYRVRGNDAKLLTEDQTHAYAMYKGGLLSYKQLANHPHRNILTQAMGVSDRLKPVITRIKGINLDTDVLLLCTDGFSHYLTIQTINGLVDTRLSAYTIGYRLLQEMENKEQHDNYSLLCIKKRKTTSSTTPDTKSKTLIYD